MITKAMRYGETITSSTQLRSKVPCGSTSMFGVVYCAVAGGKPAPRAATTVLTFAGMSDRYDDDVLVRELLADRLEVRLELGRRRALDVRAAGPARHGAERLGVVLR